MLADDGMTLAAIKWAPGCRPKAWYIQPVNAVPHGGQIESLQGKKEAGLRIQCDTLFTVDWIWDKNTALEPLMMTTFMNYERFLNFLGACVFEHSIVIRPFLSGGGGGGGGGGGRGGFFLMPE